MPDGSRHPATIRLNRLAKLVDLGEDPNVFDREMADPADLFRPLADADPGVLFQALEDAHPATIALVLSFLPNRVAVPVAGKLCPRIRQRVLQSLAVNEPTDIDAIESVAESVIQRVQRLETSGPTILLQILSESDHGYQSRSLRQLAVHEPRLAKRIQRWMVTFDELKWLTNGELDTLIKRVELKTWAVALLGDRHTLRRRVTARLSRIGRLQLEDEMCYRHAACLEERRQARHRIVAALREIRQPDPRAIA